MYGLNATGSTVCQVVSVITESGVIEFHCVHWGRASAPASVYVHVHMFAGVFVCACACVCVCVCVITFEYER